MWRAGSVCFLLVLSAAQLGAQITTYVAPPRTQMPSARMVAAADSAQRDSIAQATMTNMKAWVDSASGIAVPAHVGDSIPAGDPGRPVTTTFEDGAVAPATASNLPSLSVLGLLAIAAGALLLTRRRS